MSLNLLTSNQVNTPAFTILYFVAIIGIMYFIMIRPQRKKQKAEQAMRENIQIGDDIITLGGIYGRIIAIKDDSYVLETGSDKVKIRIAKWAIQQNFTQREIQPKDTVAKEKKTKDKKEKY